MGVFTYRLRRPEQLVSVEDYERAAAGRVPRFVWEFIQGGAEDLATVHGNRQAFSRWWLRTRAMTGHPERSLRTTVAGVELAMPILLAPTGTLGISHWAGDVAAARAAEAAGSRLILSTASSWTIEEVAEATEADRFFQLYPGGAHTAWLMQRAWSAGYRALFVTVDVPVIGNREGERRMGYARHGSTITSRAAVLTPLGAVDVLRHPRWLYELYRHRRGSMRNLVTDSGIAATLRSVDLFYREIEQARFNWDDLRWIRENWKGSLFVKGILDPEDAKLAVSIGCNGLVVSNHGGRQLDYAQPSLEALPGIVAAVGGRAEVLLDGGVRRGTDIVKALALGARAVLIGRPQIYGLIVAGERGVSGVMQILREELDRTLALMGVSGVDDLHLSWVAARPGPVDFPHLEQ